MLILFANMFEISVLKISKIGRNCKTNFEKYFETGKLLKVVSVSVSKILPNRHRTETETETPFSVVH